MFAAVSLGAPPDGGEGPIDPSQRVTIPGHTRALAAAYVDEGPLPASQKVADLVLFLKPSAAQRAALDQVLLDVQDPHSARYHQWLTPDEYAEQFGISPSDGAKITAWLEAEGFHVGYRAHTWIAFDGTAGMVEAAFQAGVHRYRSATAVHYANSVNPSIRSPSTG